MPSWRMIQPTSAEATVEMPTVTRRAPPRPTRTPASLARCRKGFSSSSGSSQTARRQPRVASTQPMPVNSSRAPAMRPTVPALSIRLWMFSWSEMPGICSAILSWSLSCWSLLSVAAAMAAARLSSGKSATKLVKVMAAASRVHFTRSSRSYERHACVVISRVSHGPTTGSFFSQSMIRLCPHSPGSMIPSCHRFLPRYGRPVFLCPRNAGWWPAPCRFPPRRPCRPAAR